MKRKTVAIALLFSLVLVLGGCVNILPYKTEFDREVTKGGGIYKNAIQNRKFAQEQIQKSEKDIHFSQYR